MMRQIIVLALLTTLSGCCHFRPSHLPEHLKPSTDTDPHVFLEVLDHTIETTEKSFIVKFRFYNEAKEYNCLIQEISLADGQVLVEVFRIPGGRMSPCRLDNHRNTWSVDPGLQIRTMFLYPGRVEGVAWRNERFAHLPQNMDGSVVTTLGGAFNKDYQEEFETRGKVVAEDRDKGVLWYIKFDSGKLEVIIPEKNRLTR